MAKLEDLARRLESLADLPREAVAEGARFAEREIRSAGRADGPLRSGNAVASHVVENGLRLVITRVHATKGGFAYGVRNDFLAKWIAGEITRAIAERMGG